jgi:hypothetical protein
MGEFRWEPEAFDGPGGAHPPLKAVWISLKDAAALFEQEGFTRKDLQRALRSGQVVAQGVPTSTGYRDIQCRCDTLISAMALRTMALEMLAEARQRARRVKQ